MDQDEPLDLLRMLRPIVEDLHLWLAWAVVPHTGGDPRWTSRPLCDAARCAGEVLASLPQIGTAIGLDPVLRPVRQCLESLETLGIGTPTDPTLDQAQSVLQAIPHRFKEVVAESIDRLVEMERSLAASSRDRADVIHAMSVGQFLGHLKRNSGKGYVRALPSFRTSDQSDRRECWCQVLIYPKDKWVIRTTFRNVRTMQELIEYEEVSSARAAALLLASDAGLGIDDVIWLQKLAESGAQLFHGEQPGRSSVIAGAQRASESLRATYHDPDNYWRNVWLYEQRKAGKKNGEILHALEGHPERFAPLATENALRNAIMSIARHHGWPELKGAPGRPPV